MLKLLPIRTLEVECSYQLEPQIVINKSQVYFTSELFKMNIAIYK